jgi:hypothetical protein
LCGTDLLTGERDLATRIFSCLTHTAIYALYAMGGMLLATLPYLFLLSYPARKSPWDRFLGAFLITLGAAAGIRVGQRSRARGELLHREQTQTKTSSNKGKNITAF